MTMTGFAGLAQADYRQCAMQITKGGALFGYRNRNPVRNYRIHKSNRRQDRPVAMLRA